MSRALVIGGGVSGMGAALLLSRLGLDVCLVEKSAGLGAVIRGFQRRGLRYETGFHYAGGLEKGAVLHRYLETLGLFRQHLVTCPLPDPGGEFLRFPESGQDFAIPRDFNRFRGLFPPEAAVFFDRGREIFARSAYLNPEISEFDPLTMYTQGESLSAALDRLPLSPPLKSLLGFRCLLYGVPPSEAFFEQFSLVNTPYLGGAHTFEGGGEALAGAFEAALQAAGVRLLTGCEIVAIQTDAQNNAVAAKFLDPQGRPEEISFDLCVYSGSPVALPSLLPEGALRPLLKRRLHGLKYTPAPFLLFGRTRSNWLEQRQIFISPDHLEDWFTAPGGLYASGGPGRDGFWPLSAVAIETGGAPAWRGGPKDAGYYQWKERRAEELARRLLRQCPELGALEIVDSATHLTFGQYSLAFGPGIYGTLHSIHEAPILPVTRVGRLALAGQNIVMPGLLGALVSSALAVGFLLKHETVLELLR